MEAKQLFISQGRTNVDFFISIMISSLSGVLVILAFLTFSDDEIILEKLLCCCMKPVSWTTIWLILHFGDCVGRILHYICT